MAAFNPQKMMAQFRAKVQASPNAQWGEVTIPIRAGGRRKLTAWELYNLGQHTFWYKGNGRWENPRKNPVVIPEADIESTIAILHASDKRQEEARRKANQSFLEDVGDVVVDVVSSPVLQGVVAAAGVVFPPALGAAAALKGASMAIAAIEKGDVAGVVGAVAGAAGGAVGINVPVVNEVLKNPIVQSVKGAVSVPEKLLRSAVGAGVGGATADARAALDNPARAPAVRAVAPKVTSIGEAQKLVDALEQADPAKAALAAAQVGVLAALAQRGDAGAKAGFELVTKARAQRTKLTGFTPELMTALEALWSSDVAIQGYKQATRAKVRPARVRSALELVLRCGFMSPAESKRMSPAARDRVQASVKGAVDVLAAVLEAARAHPASEYFRAIGGIVSGEVQRLGDSSSPYAVSALRELEKKVGAKMARRSTEVNKLVLAYNKGDPGAKKAVETLRARAKRGDPKARQGLDEVRRRAAALKAVKGFSVSADGVVRKVG